MKNYKTKTNEIGDKIKVGRFAGSHYYIVEVISIKKTVAKGKIVKVLEGNAKNW